MGGIILGFVMHLQSVIKYYWLIGNNKDIYRVKKRFKWKRQHYVQHDGVYWDVCVVKWGISDVQFKSKVFFWILLMVSFILFAETDSTMALCFSFWHYFVSVTNSPVSLLLNLFFFLPLFSFGVRYFYQLRGVSFSQPRSLYFFLSASVCLSSFWHLFANKPNQKYLYINKSGSSLKAVIIGRQPNFVSYDAFP